MSRFPSCWCFLISGLALTMAWSQTSDADAELKVGIELRGKYEYAEAIQHLEHAIALAPKMIAAHFELAVTYDQMYAPSGDSHPAEVAVVEYKKVLELDPSRADAMKGLGHLLFWLARYDEADSYYRRALAVDANDPEVSYNLAVIDFHESYRVLAKKRADLKLGFEKPFIHSVACPEIRSETLPRVEEGISLLTGNLLLLQDADALGYLGAFYEDRAQLQCGDHSSYEADKRTAIHWWQRSCEARGQVSARDAMRWPAAPRPPPSKHGNTCAF